ncbi:MAG: T9SS type A sorting domain-containing protein [Lentimicrobiaceae bacterium]|nr:T9SS type A sorting domain-containing protein [Lentimicrobiaceae bacterium]
MLVTFELAEKSEQKRFDTKTLQAGTYIVTLHVGKTQQNKKLVVIK